jgi:hypothetical protein
MDLPRLKSRTDKCSTAELAAGFATPTKTLGGPMTRRATLAIATFALILISSIASAQRASLAVGAAVPIADLANTAGSGFDADFQTRTGPVLAGLALRIDLGYDHFSGKAGVDNTTLSAQTISFVGDIGNSFYWIAGPGYYQSTEKTQILGHNVTDQRSYFGAQAALGVNIPVFRWEGFLEASAVRLFTPGQIKMYVPLRFGIRL